MFLLTAFAEFVAHQISIHTRAQEMVEENARLKVSTNIRNKHTVALILSPGAVSLYLCNQLLKFSANLWSQILNLKHIPSSLKMSPTHNMLYFHSRLHQLMLCGNGLQNFGHFGTLVSTSENVFAQYMY